MSAHVECAVCGAEIHLELGHWMTVWPAGRKTVVCRRCHRTGAWEALGEERLPGRLAAADVAAESEEIDPLAGETAGGPVAGMEGRGMPEEKTTITRKCKGCGETFEAHDGRVQRCPRCLGAPTVKRNGFGKRKAKAAGNLGEVIEARIREIMNESAAPALDLAAIEDICDRVLDRKLKARLKALLG